LDSIGRNFKGYKVAADAKKLGTEYWLRGTGIFYDLVLQTFVTPKDPTSVPYKMNTINAGWSYATAGDFNNDGLVDIFTPDATNGVSFLLFDSTKNSFKDTSLLNDKSIKSILNGAFKSTPLYLNNDDYVDLIIISGDSYSNPEIIIISDGKGGYDVVKFDVVHSVNGAPVFMTGGDVGDLNGDGYPELIVCANNFVFIYWGIQSSPYFRKDNYTLYAEDLTNFPNVVNNGPTSCSLCAGNAFDCVIRDVNKDGKNDIILNNERILVNNGTGFFSNDDVIILPKYNGGTSDITIDDNDNSILCITGGGLDGIFSFWNIFRYKSLGNKLYSLDTSSIRISTKTKQYDGDKSRLVFFDFNKDGLKDISYIDGSWGDVHGQFDSITRIGSIVPYKTVLIREGDKYVEKDYFQYDSYSKYLLTQLTKRFECAPDKLKKPEFLNSENAICKRDSIKITVFNTIEKTGLVWHSNGKNDSISGTTKYFYDSTKYYVTRYNKTYGCEISSDTFQIKLKSSPTIPIVRDTAYCIGNTSSPLKATIAENNDIYWSDKSGSIGAKYIPTPSTNIVGKQYFFATQVDPLSGCSSEQIKLTVTVENSVLAPNIRDTSFCQYSSALIGSNYQTNTLKWYEAAIGGISNSTPLNLSTKQPGSVNYYFSAISPLGSCESPRTKITVKINPLPIKPTFNTSNYSFCSGDSIRLSITNVNKGDTLKWYFGTKSDITNVANKTFFDSTKLYVTRTDSVGCIISSDTIQLTKKNIPVAPGISRDVDNNLVANINGITWYKDGVKIADTTQKIKPTSSGNYTATTTQNGCTSPVSANYYYLTSAVANLSGNEYFKISPNPTNDEIYLNYNIRSTNDVYINLIDMSGRTIISNRKVNSGTKVNLGSSMKGNYIIQVKDKAGKILTTEKLIKN
jgi:Ig-like domain CHU_C associated/Secretion system C-terminal sorting domain